jgi:hypothetical protein
MSKDVKIGDKTFNLDSVSQVMTLTMPIEGPGPLPDGVSQGDPYTAVISGVGPFQAAGLCFADVRMDSDPDAAAGKTFSPTHQYLKIVSVLPAKLDHWAEVDSSQIAAVAYDWIPQTLRVKFHGRTKKDGSVTPGSTYRYFDVPAAVVGEMLFAPSVGVAHSVLVKQGGYRYERVGE